MLIESIRLNLPSRYLMCQEPMQAHAACRDGLI